MAESEPPASIASARPERISHIAVPMASAPAARAAQLKRAGDRRAGGVREGERDHEGADAIRAALEVRAVRLVQRAHAAVRRAAAGADALVRKAELAGVGERELCGSCGQLRAAIHAAGVAAAEKRLSVEVLDAAHRGRRLAFQLEHAGPRDTVCQGVPERIDANADRAHDSNSGDHDPPAHAPESARCAAPAHPVRGWRRTWVYPGTNDRKLPASQQLSGPSPRRSLLQIPPCRPLAADGAATARPLWERTASTPITPVTAWLRQRRSGRADLSCTPTARTATWPRAWTRSEAIRSVIRHWIPPTTA